MQVQFITSQQVADLIEDSNVLSTLPGPGNALTYIIEYADQDIIMTVESATGEALVIHPCGSLDSESDGSVHDHARAILGMNKLGSKSVAP